MTEAGRKGGGRPSNDGNPIGDVALLVRGAYRNWHGFALLGALGIFGFLVARANLSDAAHRIAGAGFALLWVVVPFLGALLLDALGSRFLLRALGTPAPYGSLVLVRAATEALHYGLPGGAVVADSLGPALTVRRARVALPAAVVLTAARKLLIMRAHGFYILIAGLAAYPFLSSHSQTLVGHRGLPYGVLATALIPWSAAALVGASVGRGRAVHRLFGFLSRVRWKRLSAWALRHEATFHATDGHFADLSQWPVSTMAVATLPFLGAWFLEAVETFLILRLVGAPLAPSVVFAMEAGLSLLRSVAVVAPAGLGIQDLGYAALLHAAALPDASGITAAFLLTKRAKDVLLIGAGYGALAVCVNTPKGAHSVREVVESPVV